MVLIGLIMSLFLASTAVSTLNNAWQTVAQIRGPLVDGYLSKASLAKNGEVEKWLKEGHRERELVGIAVVENGDERAEIIIIGGQGMRPVDRVFDLNPKDESDNFRNVVQIAIFAGSSKSLNFGSRFILLWTVSSGNPT
ncbi:MAG: hypothetical protein M1813_006749 [Trichoglossum hirsutum]|nr:MAG: hypothetical protein M1813_006749 [Trichoglossum hirsutum]